MARKKQTYEEQRMDELLYAEEYRRRLRMERETENTEVAMPDTPDVADVEADDGELELIRRDREQRKKKNDDILSRVTRIYTVPANPTEGVEPTAEEQFATLDNEGNIELVGEDDGKTEGYVNEKPAKESGTVAPEADWTPITKEPDKKADDGAIRIEIGASSVAHTLHIEGVEITGVSAGYTAEAETVGADVDYVGISRKRGGSVLHTSDSFGKYVYADEENKAPEAENSTPVPDKDGKSTQDSTDGGVIFTEGYADDSAFEAMQSFIYAPISKGDAVTDTAIINEIAYTDSDSTMRGSGVVFDMSEDIGKPYIPDTNVLNDGTEEDELLSFLKYTESRNRELANGKVGSPLDMHNTHTTRDTTADGYSEADANGKSRMSEKDEREHKNAGAAAERREIEADMERFLREDAEYKKNLGNKNQTGTIPDQPTVHPFDRNALKKEEKVQCERDIAFIEARINSRLDMLLLERDSAELTFTEDTKADRRETSKRDREINDTKIKLRDAVYLERQDNTRYYSFVLMDLLHENLPKNANLKLLVSLREKLISLLYQRDTVNKRLTELYLGEEGGKKSANRERDKARRNAMRAEFNKHKNLNNRIKNSHLEKTFAGMLRELMDKQVLLAGELAECRHILRRERPTGQAAKDVKERERRADAEYKKNVREIDRISKKAFKDASIRKHKSNSAVLGWIALLAIAIVGVVVWLNWESLGQYIGQLISDVLPGLVGGLNPGT